MTPFLGTAEARACYRRIERRLRAQGAWRDEYALGLAPVAAFAAAYLDDVRTMGKSATPETAKLLDMLLKRRQRLARHGLKLFAVLPAMNAQDLDAEIAKLCAPLPRLVDSASTPLDLESA